MNNESFWLKQRTRVCLPADSINLNAGSLSPNPIPVVEALERLRREQAATPSDFTWRKIPALIERSRERLAAYLHGLPTNLTLLPNVTYAINVAAESLRLERGAEILVTDHEYGAMVYSFQRLATERGWQVRTFKLPESPGKSSDFTAAIDAAITPATKVLLFSHVTSGLGLVLPAQEICALARKRGVTSVVDGAHAVGMIELDLERIDADFYGGNCHKWMMAPVGAGFLYVRESHKANLRTPVVSWGWGYRADESNSVSPGGGLKWQYALEFRGCTERGPQMVLPETLDFLESLGGHASIAQRVRELSLFTRERLTACGLKAATPSNPELYGSLIAFEFAPPKDLRPPGPDAGPHSTSSGLELRDYFWKKHRIECPIFSHSGKLFLRISTAWFNTREEIERLAQAVVR